MTDIKMLPLPTPNGDYTNPYDGDDLEDYALAVAEHNVKALLSLLGECYVLAGADTDGDPPERHALDAVQAVRDLRKDYDEACEEMHGPDGYAARAERLAEALALLPDETDMIEYNPDEGMLMSCCGREVKSRGPYGLIITHDKDCWYVSMCALRDNDKEGKDG